MSEFINLYGESAKTALGFFWKSGWDEIPKGTLTNKTDPAAL